MNMNEEIMAEKLPTRDDFAGCLHSMFRVMDDPRIELDLELVQVSELQVTSSSQVFSILFQGPDGWFMPQHIYLLRHERLGDHEVFLVPVGKEGGSVLYEAVFNQLIEASEQENRKAPVRGE